MAKKYPDFWELSVTWTPSACPHRRCSIRSWWFVCRSFAILLIWSLLFIGIIMCVSANAVRREAVSWNLLEIQLPKSACKVQLHTWDSMTQMRELLPSWLMELWFRTPDTWLSLLSVGLIPPDIWLSFLGAWLSPPDNPPVFKVTLLLLLNFTSPTLCLKWNGIVDIHLVNLGKVHIYIFIKIPALFDVMIWINTWKR